MHDVIGCQLRSKCSSVQDFKGFKTTATTNILFIVQPIDPKKYEWKLGVVNITGSENDNIVFTDELESKLKGMHTYLVFLCMRRNSGLKKLM